MLKRRRKKNISKKKKIIVLCLIAALIIGLTIWANYYFKGEWKVVGGSSGNFGAKTYYDGGYGLIQVESPGIYIRYTANVSNDGTMILAIREADDDVLNTGNYDAVYDLKVIQSIEISGNETKEVYISSDDYSEVILHEYTLDGAEATTSWDELDYTSSTTKFAKWLNNITFGKFDKQIDSIFDIH